MHAPRRRPRLRFGALLLGAVIAVLISLLPARLFLGKSYVTLTYTLAESGTLEGSELARLREAERRLQRGLRGRADVELDARGGALVVDVDDTRIERAKRGIHRRLPELTLVDQRPALGTSVVTFVLPVLVSLLWLLFVRRFDRAHPEPWPMMLRSFGGGLVAAWLAGALQWLIAATFPQLPEALQGLADDDLSARAWLLGSAVSFFYAGVLEESAKLLAFRVAVSRQHHFDEPVDGIVYAASIALGFAAAENVRYFADGNLAPALVVGRTFVAVPTHVFVSSLWGRALGERLIDRRVRVWPALLAAIVLHAGFDVLSLAVRGPSSFVLPPTVALLSLLLFRGLRTTLRFGRTSDMRAVRGEEERFTTGSRARFLALLAAFFVLSFVLVALSSFFQLAHPTGLMPLALSATACALLLALLGYMVTEHLPLDVELDRYGLRYAGQSYAWHEIDDEPAPYRAGVALRARGAPIYLGPLPKAERERLTRAIEQRRDEAPPASLV